jgi:YVTN family beta-propeller protein
MEDGASLSQDVSRGVSALAISPVKEEIYMLNAALGTLTIIDLTGARRQLVVPVGKQPAVLVVSGDGTRVYVADEVGASVIAIDVESARVVESIPLPGTPLALAVR